jgi:hypothetical protein
MTFLSRIIVFGLLAALCSVPVFANVVTVDCSGASPGAFSSISTALATLPKQGPNTVLVSGHCVDNVLIFGFSDLVIQAQGTVTITSPKPRLVFFEILGSREVSVSGPIAFDGGGTAAGISIAHGSTVSLDGITVENSAFNGIISSDSVTDLSNSTIQNNARSGIFVSGGTFGIDGGVSVTNNGEDGVRAFTSNFIVSGGDGTPGTENFINNNHGTGILVSDAAGVSIFGVNHIDNNTAAGLRVLHASSAVVSDSTISLNTGAGAECGGSSHCQWSRTTIRNNGAGGIAIVDHADGSLDGGVNVDHNTGIGVLVDLSSLLTSSGSNAVTSNTDDGIVVNDLSVLKFAVIDTIAGNGRINLECDNASLVVGDISSIRNVDCTRVHLARRVR